MKKFLIITLSLVISLSSMVLIACTNSNHEHDYKNLKHDAKAHWYECDCGDKKSQEKHSGGTVNENSKAICEVCNQEYTVSTMQNHTHAYTILEYDTQNHWYKCSCGEKGNVEAHNGGTATETQKAKCSVCNQEYGSLLIPGHTHNFNKQVTTDAHKKSPATCKGPAIYYYSCDCGTNGTETFTSGNTGTHNYISGACEYCGAPEVQTQIGPMTKNQWQAELLSIATNGVKNGKFTIGPVEDPGEYTIYESDGNVVRQRVYDNNNLSLDVYCEKDGDKYYIYQEVQGTWYKMEDNDNAFDQIQLMMSYGAMFYDSYNEFTYNESTNTYVATNLVIQDNVFDSVKLTFENSKLTSVNIVDYDDNEDGSQTHVGFRQELINLGSTVLTLPEEYTQLP